MLRATLCLLFAVLLMGQGLVVADKDHLTPPITVSKSLNDFLIIENQDIKETTSQSPASQSSAIKLYNVGNRFYNIGNYDKAIQAYSNATNQDPNLIEAWNNEANALLYDNRLNDALQAYDQVLILDNKSAHAWAVKGWILIHKQNPQYGDALDSLEKAIELEPNTNNTAWYLNEMGNALYGLDRVTEALEAKSKSLDLNSNLWFTWYDTAEVLRSICIYSEALNAVNKAIELNPPVKDAQDAQHLKEDILNKLDSQRYTGSS